MNERIRELAEQADEYAEQTVHYYQGQFDGLTWEGKIKQTRDTKFAELIVRMCADAADMYEGKSDCVGDCVAEYMGYGQEEGVTEWRAK